MASKGTQKASSKGTQNASSNGTQNASSNGTQKASSKRFDKRKKFDKRQKDVADAAARVFAEQGYHATTINDLVQATGLQRGGLYHYIESKKDLLVRIHEAFLEPLLADAREVAASDESPEIRLRRLASLLMQAHIEYHDHITVFLTEWRTISTDPAWEDIRKGRKEFEAILEGVLQDGVDEGVFECADVGEAVLGLLGMINYSNQWLNPQGRVAPERVAADFTDVFLYGISTQGRQPRKQKRRSKPTRRQRGDDRDGTKRKRAA